MKLGRAGTILAVAGAAVAAGGVAYALSGGAAKPAPAAGGGTAPTSGGAVPTAGANPPAGATILTPGTMTVFVGSTTQYVWAPKGGKILSASGSFGAQTLLAYCNVVVQKGQSCTAGYGAVAFDSSNLVGIVFVVWTDGNGVGQVTTISAVNPNPGSGGGSTSGNTLAPGAMSVSSNTVIDVPSGATIQGTSTTGTALVVQSPFTIGGDDKLLVTGSGTVTVNWTPSGGSPTTTTITVS